MRPCFDLCSMRRDAKVGLGLLLVSVALGGLGDALFHGVPLGVNVLVWTVAFTAALALLLRVGRVAYHQGRRWMLAPLVLFAACFAWRDSSLLTAANLIAIAGAVVLGALRRTQPRVARAGVADYAAGAAAAGFAAFGGAVQLLHRDVPWSEATRGARSPVARGIALGLPLLALFGGLFAAADAVFRGFLSDAVPSFAHPLAHILLFAAFAWAAGGLLRDLVAEREDGRLLAPGAVSRAVPRVSLGATELAVALAGLDLLFLAFVLVQLRYLFGGAHLVHVRAHLTYAHYARHGFFELVAVSLLVLPLLLAVDAAGRRTRALRFLSAALLALTFVVMASALQRMRLYEHVYGLTELRVYATGVILWLAVVLVWFALTVLRGYRRHFAVGVVVAGFAATAALDALNPDALIARTNLSRPRVDVAYLAGLGDDAVPTLVARLPQLDPRLREPLARALLRRHEGGDWRSWSFSRSRARSSLTRLARP
jgi:hypothetical protein